MIFLCKIALTFIATKDEYLGIASNMNSFDMTGEAETTESASLQYNPMIDYQLGTDNIYRCHLMVSYWSCRPNEGPLTRPPTVPRPHRGDISAEVTFRPDQRGGLSGLGRRAGGVLAVSGVSGFPHLSPAVTANGSGH